jgi:hypothetical protein
MSVVGNEKRTFMSTLRNLRRRCEENPFLKRHVRAGIVLTLLISVSLFTIFSILVFVSIINYGAYSQYSDEIALSYPQIENNTVVSSQISNITNSIFINNASLWSFSLNPPSSFTILPPQSTELFNSLNETLIANGLGGGDQQTLGNIFTLFIGKTLYLKSFTMAIYYLIFFVMIIAGVFVGTRFLANTFGMTKRIAESSKNWLFAFTTFSFMRFYGLLVILYTLIVWFSQTWNLNNNFLGIWWLNISVLILLWLGGAFLKPFQNALGMRFENGCSSILGVKSFGKVAYYLIKKEDKDGLLYLNFAASSLRPILSIENVEACFLNKIKTASRIHYKYFSVSKTPWTEFKKISFAFSSFESITNLILNVKEIGNEYFYSWVQYEKSDKTNKILALVGSVGTAFLTVLSLIFSEYGSELKQMIASVTSNYFQLITIEYFVIPLIIYAVVLLAFFLSNIEILVIISVIKWQKIAQMDQD